MEGRFCEAPCAGLILSDFGSPRVFRASACPEKSLRAGYYSGKFFTYCSSRVLDQFATYGPRNVDFLTTSILRAALRIFACCSNKLVIIVALQFSLHSNPCMTPLCETLWVHPSRVGSGRPLWGAAARNRIRRSGCPGNYLLFLKTESARHSPHSTF